LSLKNDIEMVKEELNSEEKFFEKAVITEKFVQKYKSAMIAGVIAVVVIVGGNIAYDINKASQISAANMALSKLQKDASDTDSLAKLATLSPALYDVWNYSQAVASKDIKALELLQNSKAVLLSDLAKYELAQASQNTQKLDEYSSMQNAIYTDLAQIQSALLLINDGKIDFAHQKLSMINEDSPLYATAKSLRHYGVK